MDGMCSQCDDNMDKHVLINTTGDPMDGGFMLCPVVGCQCFSTWGVGEDSSVPSTPDPAEVAALRERIQSP